MRLQKTAVILVLVMGLGCATPALAMGGGFIADIFTRLSYVQDQIEAKANAAFRLDSVRKMMDQINQMKDMTNKIQDMKGALIKQAEDAARKVFNREKMSTLDVPTVIGANDTKIVNDQIAAALAYDSGGSTLATPIATCVGSYTASSKFTVDTRPAPDKVKIACEGYVASMKVNKLQTAIQEKQKADVAAQVQDSNTKSAVAAQAAQAAGNLRAKVAKEGSTRLDASKAAGAATNDVIALKQLAKANNGNSEVTSADWANLFTPLTGMDGRSYMNYGNVKDSKKLPVVILGDQAALLAKIMVGAQPLPLPTGKELENLQANPDLMIKRFSRFGREQMAIAMMLRLFDQQSNDTLTQEISTMMAHQMAVTTPKETETFAMQREQMAGLAQLMMDMNLQLLTLRRGQWEQNAVLGLIMTSPQQAINVMGSVGPNSGQGSAGNDADGALE